MKKTSLFLMTAALLAGAISCNKGNVPSQEVVDPALKSGTLTVTIGAAEEETKAAIANMKDFRINNVQVFVFDAAGRLETDVYKESLNVDNSTQVTINTKTGAKTVYALVNNSRLTLTPGSTGELLANFEDRLTDLSENSSETDLVMSGKNSVDVAEYNNQGAGGAPTPVSIYVKRLASRIQLDGVTVDFRGTSLEGASFDVMRIYLKNVVSKSPIGVQGLTGTAATTVQPKLLPDGQYAWYNKMKEETGAPSVVSDLVNEPCTVAGVKTDLNRVLFTFPNATNADSHADTWGARHTRLVIQAHVTKASVSIDKDTYYVLDLPILAANTIYEVQNVNITQLGKDDDTKDDAIQVGKLTATITVDPWNPSVVNLNYEQ